VNRLFSVLDVEQGSSEWLQARCARITGTCAKDLLSTIKSGEAAGRRNLRAKMVVERLTQMPQEDGYVSQDMRRGTELEPEARAIYEAVTGALVTPVGFLAHDTLPVGFSPDGIVGDFEGLVELKCPKMATHLSYLTGQTLPSDYAAQVRHGMWLSGVQWCDFCSYDPRFPEHLQLFRVRVERNEFELMAYGRVVEAFLAEVEKEYQSVLKLGMVAA
jgi:hypothetical protein